MIQIIVKHLIWVCYKCVNMSTRSVFDGEFISELGWWLWLLWPARFCSKPTWFVFHIFLVHGGDEWQWSWYGSVTNVLICVLDQFLMKNSYLSSVGGCCCCGPCDFAVNTRCSFLMYFLHEGDEWIWFRAKSGCVDACSQWESTDVIVLSRKFIMVIVAQFVWLRGK